MLAFGVDGAGTIDLQAQRDRLVGILIGEPCRSYQFRSGQNARGHELQGFVGQVLSAPGPPQGHCTGPARREVGGDARLVGRFQVDLQRDVRRGELGRLERNLDHLPGAGVEESSTRLIAPWSLGGRLPLSSASAVGSRNNGSANPGCAGT